MTLIIGEVDDDDYDDEGGGEGGDLSLMAISRGQMENTFPTKRPPGGSSAR